MKFIIHNINVQKSIMIIFVYSNHVNRKPMFAFAINKQGIVTRSFA